MKAMQVIQELHDNYFSTEPRVSCTACCSLHGIIVIPVISLTSASCLGCPAMTDNLQTANKSGGGYKPDLALVRVCGRIACIWLVPVQDLIEAMTARHRHGRRHRSKAKSACISSRYDWGNDSHTQTQMQTQTMR